MGWAMKYLVGVFMLAALVLSVACGGSSSNGSNVNVNGNWSVALSGTGGNQVLTFTTTLVQSGNNGLSGENLTFTTNSACFADGGTETGTLTINGNTGGVTSAGIQLTIASTGSAAGNMLTLNGTLQSNTVTGTWTLNGGTGCTGNGNFTMTKVG